MSDHVQNFFAAAAKAASEIDTDKIDRLVLELVELRQRMGRLFVLGVGGSAANASHAVNDFRKLCNIEAYAPTDNVAELTARTNDEGWDTVFRAWLRVSQLYTPDALLVFSVGGGDAARNVSVGLVKAIDLARERNTKVFSVLGSVHGYAAWHSDITICLPGQHEKWLTPLSEAFQALVWHCLVSDPRLQMGRTKW